MLFEELGHRPSSTSAPLEQEDRLCWICWGKHLADWMAEQNVPATTLWGNSLGEHYRSLGYMRWGEDRLETTDDRYQGAAQEAHCVLLWTVILLAIATVKVKIIIDNLIHLLLMKSPVENYILAKTLQNVLHFLPTFLFGWKYNLHGSKAVA